MTGVGNHADRARAPLQRQRAAGTTEPGSHPGALQQGALSRRLALCAPACFIDLADVLRKHTIVRGDYVRDWVYFSVIDRDWPRVSDRLRLLR